MAFVENTIDPSKWGVKMPIPLGILCNTIKHGVLGWKLAKLYLERHYVCPLV